MLSRGLGTSGKSVIISQWYGERVLLVKMF